MTRFGSLMGALKEENIQIGHCLQCNRLKGGPFSICFEKMSKLSNEKLPTLTIRNSEVVLSPVNHFNICLVNDLPLTTGI